MIGVTLIMILVMFVCIIALIIGIINPKLVIMWGAEEKKNRKKVILLYGGIALFLYITTRLIGMAMVSHYTSVLNNSNTVQQSPSSSNSSTSSNSNSSTSNSSNNSASQTPIKVTPAELKQAYESNEVNAEKKYKGKVVIITGKISDIRTSMGSAVIGVSSQSKAYIDDVSCYFDDNSQDDRIANLSKGQTITIKGTVGSNVVGVSIDDCTIQ
jgi:cytoskeletal protein RodZ